MYHFIGHERNTCFHAKFCHFVLSEAERISNGLRLADNEQIFFYTHLIACLLYKQGENFISPNR